jgi:hypothetical protein
MKLKILKDRQGKIIATVEVGVADLVTPTPKIGKGVKVEEVDALEEYSSRLDAFYKEATKKPRRTTAAKRR